MLHQIYRVLMTNGIADLLVPVLTTTPERAVDAATLWHGRDGFWVRSVKSAVADAEEVCDSVA